MRGAERRSFVDFPLEVGERFAGKRIHEIEIDVFENFDSRLDGPSCVRSRMNATEPCEVLVRQTLHPY